MSSSSSSWGGRVDRDRKVRRNERREAHTHSGSTRKLGYGVSGTCCACAESFASPDFVALVVVVVRRRRLTGANSCCRPLVVFSCSSMRSSSSWRRDKARAAPRCVVLNRYLIVLQTTTFIAVRLLARSELETGACNAHKERRRSRWTRQELGMILRARVR